jgi:hypothetical protein
MSVRPQYVHYVPETLDSGVLYISKKFMTASHLCCCGCGIKIVTPFSPTEYELTEIDNEVSLHPSIGNWNHPCQSHYLIKRNAVIWVGRMSRAEIEAGRALDAALRDAYYGEPVPSGWRALLLSITTWWKRLFG